MTSGIAAVGCSGDRLNNWLPIDVKRRGAVSPTALAMASRLPVTSPASAPRRTTDLATLERRAPSASAASRSSLGTASMAASLARMTMGNISTASAKLPASAEKCRRGSTSTT